jgi:hypothetical protein
LNDQIKEDEMGKFSMLGEMRNAYKKSENLRGRNYLEDLGIDGRG